MPVNYIEHKGKKILFIDLKEMVDQEAMIKDGKETARLIKEKNEPTRLLVDMTNSAAGTEFMSSIKEDGKFILKNIPMKTAVTGITGLKNIMLQGYIKFTGSKLRSFPTLDEAKEYLGEGDQI